MNLSSVFVIDNDEASHQAVQAATESLDFLYKSYPDCQEFSTAHDHPEVGCLILGTSDHPDFVECLQRTARGIVPTIALANRGDIPTAVECMQNGATTVLAKPLNPNELVDAIQTAVQASRSQIERLHRTKELSIAFDSLTDRQHQIIEHVLNGRQNKWIASALDVSRRTIESERSVILRKFGAVNSIQLATLLTELRLGQDSMGQ